MVPEDHLDHAGGGDREQRAEHAEEFDPEEDGDDDSERVQLDGAGER
jgi:hypothetical protein